MALSLKQFSAIFLFVLKNNISLRPLNVLVWQMRIKMI